LGQATTIQTTLTTIVEVQKQRIEEVSSMTAFSLNAGGHYQVEKLKAETAALRQRLKQLNVWPEAGDELLILLPTSYWQAPPLTEEDGEWLSIVAEDALEGVDIGSRYPAFFQKLITNSSLRQSFLDELERQTGTTT
jgi:hypothetical protein